MCINANEKNLHASLIMVLFTIQVPHPSQFLYHNLFWCKFKKYN